MLFIQLLTVFDLLVSWYAYSIERKTQRQQDYKAFCDLKESMSCTKAFASPYGKLFGVSNSLKGLVFYAAMLLLTFFGQTTFVFVLALVSFWGTLYLAYLSYFKMKNFCVVCHIIYVINLLLFIFAIRVLLAA